MLYLGRPSHGGLCDTPTRKKLNAFIMIHSFEQFCKCTSTMVILPTSIKTLKIHDIAFWDHVLMRNLIKGYVL